MPEISLEDQNLLLRVASFVGLNARCEYGRMLRKIGPRDEVQEWNPLKHDGNCFWLMSVMLNKAESLSLFDSAGFYQVFMDGRQLSKVYKGDNLDHMHDARRLAIVLAADCMRSLAEAGEWKPADGRFRDERRKRCATS